MARVKLSALLTALQGKYGGGVFRNHRGSTTLASAQSSHKNHYTAEQIKYRELLGYLSKAWKTLSWSEKDKWEEVAVFLSVRWGNYKDAAGTMGVIRTPRGPFTGIDAFISAHSLLGSVDFWDTADALRSAPVGVSSPSPPIVTAFVGSTVMLSVGWTMSQYWGHNSPSGRIRVFMKSENSTYYPQLMRWRGPGSSGTNVMQMKARGSGQLLSFTHGVYLVQLDTVNVHGLSSAPSNIFKVLI